MTSIGVPLISVKLQYEQDLVAVRQRARQIAGLAGFEPQDQTRIATAVSEIARNAFRYAKNGRVDFSIDIEDGARLRVRVSDSGPGIENLPQILQGRFKSSTGMGIGLHGARRLMDGFDVHTGQNGTVVTLEKELPKRAGKPTSAFISQIAAELAATKAENAYDELQLQNQELVRALDELRSRQDELAQLNRELEDTNRGVVALYSELDEKAEHLRRADQLKSTFLSHMSHEFRTPLNSITALSKLLLLRVDGTLTDEQQKQVEFIGRAAQELTDLVNDLLDLAKVEAGKIEVHPSEWTVDALLGSLRGMLRPLVANSPVQFTVEEPHGIPLLFTDESKVAQIVRNFISNAIKFTEHGEIRVRASHVSDTLCIAVSDTGIGIAPEDLGRIFEQFVQVDSSRQRKVRGTGLGLPLSKKLAELLGGNIQCESTPGRGSTFTLRVPVRYGQMSGETFATAQVPEHARVLVIDDEEIARYIVRKNLAELDLILEEAHDGAEGLRLAREHHPNVIVLDLSMPGLDGFQVLDELKREPETRAIPVIIHTSKTIRDADRDRLANQAAAIVDKAAQPGEELRRVIGSLVHSPASSR